MVVLPPEDRVNECVARSFCAKFVAACEDSEERVSASHSNVPGEVSQSLPKRSDWRGCCESQTRGPERGSVSRSNVSGSRNLDSLPRRSVWRSGCGSQIRAPSNQAPCVKQG